jgi:ABC-type amino acid transport substrate-binding protein
MRYFTLVLALLASLPAQAETAFDRILASGTIRCGYYVFPPATYRDVNTGKLSGFSVDFMERLAERAGLKVEWTEEVTFGNWVASLQANRYDLTCTPMWPELPMARAVLFTHSLFYAGIYPVVRADDTRFSHITDFEQLNRPEYSFLIQDGDAGSFTREIANKAKIHALAPDTASGLYYEELLSKKADVALTDRNAVTEINKARGNQLKLLLADKPLKIQSFPLAMARGETELRDFLNLAIDEMNYSGEIDRILRKWESKPGEIYLRVAPPYAP